MVTYWQSKRVARAIAAVRGGPTAHKVLGGNEWVQFWIDEARRVLAPAYVPTPADMLKLRRPTSGVAELPFVMPVGGRPEAMVLVDVGGQTHEMKTWEAELLAPNLKGVIFMLSLADFDRRKGDAGGAGLLDEFALLDAVLDANPALQTLPLAIMLNKRDLFQAKLRSKAFKGRFHHFVKACPRDVSKCKSSTKVPVEILQKHFFQIERRGIATATARLLIPAERVLCDFFKWQAELAEGGGAGRRAAHHGAARRADGVRLVRHGRGPGEGHGRRRARLDPGAGARRPGPRLVMEAGSR